MISCSISSRSSVHDYYIFLRLCNSINRVTPMLLIWKWHLWIIFIFIFISSVTGNLFILGMLAFTPIHLFQCTSFQAWNVEALQFLPYSESNQQGPGLFKAAETQRRETDYRRDLGIVLESPGLLFCFVLERLVWVISHLSIEWASSKSVSLTHTCAPRAARQARLWALNIAFVPEWMSVFPFCKKLYLLRLWLCSD